MNLQFVKLPAGGPIVFNFRSDQVHPLQAIREVFCDFMQVVIIRSAFGDYLLSQESPAFNPMIKIT